jgi:hypothetical protein
MSDLEKAQALFRECFILLCDKFVSSVYIANDSAARTRNALTSFPPSDPRNGNGHDIINLEFDAARMFTEIDIKDASRTERQARLHHIHDDQALCELLLTEVKSTYAVEIRKSTISEAGSGLFAKQDISAFRDAFRSTPLFAMPVGGALSRVCGHCFAVTGGV